jgi:steroid delta-isomerase-like uncharacterized protein
MAPTTSAESRALMVRITAEIWDQGRVDLVDELIAVDLVDHIEQAGLEGTGRERYRSSVVAMRTGFPDFANPIDLVVAQDDLAVSHGRMTGTHTGDLMGLPPTGRTIDVPTIGILRFANGRAVERWGVADNMTMMQQLGVLG